MPRMMIECEIDGVDYSPNVVFPFEFSNVLDATLDSATLNLERVPKEIFEPLTSVTIRIRSNGSLGALGPHIIYWIISSDQSEESPVGSGLYRHQLSLIELTKYLEGFIVDSICVTHPGGNVYTDNAKPVEPEET